MPMSESTTFRLKIALVVASIVVALHWLGIG
jgi:hypothetical protein